jgi:hypothetical protein
LAQTFSIVVASSPGLTAVCTVAMVILHGPSLFPAAHPRKEVKTLHSAPDRTILAAEPLASQGAPTLKS